jgi:hypothetical protein
VDRRSPQQALPLDRRRRLQLPQLGSWAAVIAFSPIGVCRTFSRSLNIASISISGRGGQPGRYMSTGTTWSTPCTSA